MSGELYPLFITDPVVSASTVNAFINVSSADPKLSTGNVWVLVTSPSCEIDTKTPTSPQVESLTVDKSLYNASLDYLGEIVRSHFPDQGTMMFCILDSRSSEVERTALLVKWEIWTEYVDPNATSGIDDAANRRQTEGWQTLRVKWENAARVMDGLEYLNVHEFGMNPRTEDGFERDVFVL